MVEQNRGQRARFTTEIRLCCSAFHVSLILKISFPESLGHYVSRCLTSSFTASAGQSRCRRLCALARSSRELQLSLSREPCGSPSSLLLSQAASGSAGVSDGNGDLRESPTGALGSRQITSEMARNVSRAAQGVPGPRELQEACRVLQGLRTLGSRVSQPAQVSRGVGGVMWLVPQMPMLGGVQTAGS